MDARAAALALALVGAAGCGSRVTTPAEAPVPAVEAPAPAAPGPASSAAPGPAITPAAPGADPSLLWRDSADLDGDGAADAIALVAQSPNILVQDGSQLCEDRSSPESQCFAVLSVNDARAHIVVVWGHAGDDPDSEVQPSVVDLDRSDPRKEILLQQQDQGSEDPPTRLTLVGYDGKRLVQHEVPTRSSNLGDPPGLELRGDGTFVVRDSQCPDLLEVEYELTSAGVLQEKRRETKRVWKLEDCAG